MEIDDEDQGAPQVQPVPEERQGTQQSKLFVALILNESITGVCRSTSGF